MLPFTFSMGHKSLIAPTDYACPSKEQACVKNRIFRSQLLLYENYLFRKYLSLSYVNLRLLKQNFLSLKMKHSQVCDGESLETKNDRSAVHLRDVSSKRNCEIKSRSRGGNNKCTWKRICFCCIN